MIRENDTKLAVLVVEDITETRDGIEKLLKADGYRVAVARDERDAIESARLKHPDLILVSLAGLSSEVIVTARRIRERAEVGEQVPVVVFCVEGIGEGGEHRDERHGHRPLVGVRQLQRGEPPAGPVPH